jgi:hypothetical protein
MLEQQQVSATHSDEKAASQESATSAKPCEASPGQTIKKSPVKRMNTLETKDLAENQENIETTYLNSQRDSVDGEQLDPKFLLPETMPARTILGQQNQLQD